MLIVGCIYSYFFSQNLLENTSYSALIERGLVVNVFDTNEEKIIAVNSHHNYQIPAVELPQGIVNAVLAMHYILNGSREACSPYLPIDTLLQNRCQYISANIMINNYILYDFINSDVNRGRDQDGLLLKIKQFIALHWLKKHFHINNYYSFLLNFGYYGGDTIGLSSAIKNFFGEDTKLEDITPGQAAFLASTLYHNTVNLYPNSQNMPPIDKNNILDTMFKLRFISEQQWEEGKTQDLNIHYENINILYQLFAKNVFDSALQETVNSNYITVQSTLNKNLQSSFSQILLNTSSTHNIPQMALFGVNNGEVVAGFAFNRLDETHVHYYDQLPDVTARHLLRPMLYLALLNNHVQLPDSLINPKVQGILRDINLAPKELAKQYSIFYSKNEGNHNKDAKYEMAFEKIIDQFSTVEKELFSRLSADNITHLTTNLMLPSESIVKKGEDYSLTATFGKIVNSYAILNQNGKYYTPIFMKKVNDRALPASATVISPFSKEDIDTVNSIIKNDSINERSYRVIYDLNMAIIYYKGYTIGVWLGNNTTGNSGEINNNNYSVLRGMVKQIASVLVAYADQQPAPTN